MAVAHDAVQDDDRFDDRDRRAAAESMIVVKEGPGLFEVYSGTQGRYTVDLQTGACECEDARFNQPEGGCKHLRRIRQLLGLDPIPDDVRADRTLELRRERGR